MTRSTLLVLLLVATLAGPAVASVTDVRSDSPGSLSTNAGPANYPADALLTDSLPTAGAALGVFMSDDDDGSVRITEILSGSPAEEAGLVVGDRLLSLDGQAVANSNAIRRAVAAQEIGARVELYVARGKLQGNLTATLGPAAVVFAAPPATFGRRSMSAAPSEPVINDAAPVATSPNAVRQTTGYRGTPQSRRAPAPRIIEETIIHYEGIPGSYGSGDQGSYGRGSMAHDVSGDR